MTKYRKELLDRLNSSINKMIEDLNKDKLYVKDNLKTIQDADRLTGWHDSVLPIVESWHEKVTSTKENPNNIETEEFKSTLSSMQSIHQGFDDSFDWSMYAERIKINRSLIPNLAKQLLLDLYGKEPIAHMQESSYKLEKELSKLVG